MLYFWACRLNPLVQQIVPSPLSANQAPPKQTPTAQTAACEVPPHMDRRPFDGPRPTHCYGCGNEGHNMATCPKLAELEQKKIIKRDNRGRWCMFDGTPIYRKVPGEPLATAAARLRTGQANFIAYRQPRVETDDEQSKLDLFYPVQQPSNYYMTHCDSSNSDSEYEVYAAERPEHTI